MISYHIISYLATSSLSKKPYIDQCPPLLLLLLLLLSLSSLSFSGSTQSTQIHRSYIHLIITQQRHHHSVSEPVTKEINLAKFFRMVFTSIPVYADPQNWNQQQTPETPKNVSTTGPTNRPASMTEQARMAKVPPPDPALPCPRCESTNTKFCYYNNYSLTQPRHFCKTCRRYWTRGGALRNVPVGGGLRRNKRSKSASKSSSSSATSAGANRQVNASTGTSNSGSTAITNPNASHLPFISPLHHMSHDYNTTSLPNLGLGFANMQPIDSLEYQVENGGNGLSIGLESWRIPNTQTQNQLPFLPGMYSLEGEGMMKLSAPGLITQFASVKMEDHNNNTMPSLNLPRAFQLDNPGNDIYCTGGSASGFSTSCEVSGGWTMDLAGFNSASIQGNIL